MTTIATFYMYSIFSKDLIFGVIESRAVTTRLSDKGAILNFSPILRQQISRIDLYLGYELFKLND